MMPFFHQYLILAFIKAKINSLFLSNGGVFWGFVSDIAYFLKSLFYLTNREKSQNQNFVDFFQLLTFFSKIQTATIYCFLCSASWLTACENGAKLRLQWNRRVQSAWVVAPLLYVSRLVT